MALKVQHKWWKQHEKRWMMEKKIIVSLTAFSTAGVLSYACILWHDGRGGKLPHLIEKMGAGFVADHGAPIRDTAPDPGVESKGSSAVFTTQVLRKTALEVTQALESLGDYQRAVT